MNDETTEETTEHIYDDADQPLPDSMPGTETPYVPVFDPSVRTAIYVACTILGVILAVAAPVAVAAHAPEWATILLSAMAGAIPTVAAAFGVAYNPSRKV